MHLLEHFRMEFLGQDGGGSMGKILSDWGKGVSLQGAC